MRKDGVHRISANSQKIGSGGRLFFLINDVDIAYPQDCMQQSWGKEFFSTKFPESLKECGFSIPTLILL